MSVNFKIALPLSVPVTKTKHFNINLNVYRNSHHFTLNTAKQVFTDTIIAKLMDLPKNISDVQLSYVLYPGTNHKQDLSNILSIVDKFFCDTLTKAGVIEDDNYNIIKQVTYSFGSVDRENPRAEVILTGELHENHS